ncbi:radical SAM protein [Candidatus Woesearchaeota archaeon]|nr:radical SAM protein [Candidatus Woesearchaeota archaeon]
MDLLIVGAGFSSLRNNVEVPLLPLFLGELNSVAKSISPDVSVLDLNVELYLARKKGIFNYSALKKSFFKDYLAGGSPNSTPEKLIFTYFDSIKVLFNSYIKQVPNVALFSVPYSCDINSSLLLAKLLKELNPDVKIVFGGTFFNDNIKFSKGVLLEKYSFIDVVATGSMGDVAPLLFALSSGSNLTSVPSIYFRKNNVVTFSDIQSSKKTPLLCPDFSNFNIDSYRSIHPSGEILIPYRFMDGCPHNCSFCRFCLSQDFFAKKPADVKKDLDLLKSQTNSNNFYFLNNTVNVSESFIVPYLDVFSELKIRWSDSARPEKISPSLAEKLKLSGCVSLTFGVESFSQKDLDLMDKGFKISDIVSTLKNVHDAGIITKINLIYGIPFQSAKSLSDSFSNIDIALPFIDLVYAFRFYISGDMNKNPSKYGVKIKDICYFEEVDGRLRDELEACFEEMYLLLKNYFISRKTYCYFSYKDTSIFNDLDLFLPLNPKFASFKEWAFLTLKS